jgi:glycosyltransferase involved in cell wall biosynthesis
LEPLSNVRYSRHFPTREEYWDFISSVDIAFSCSYHETFGIAMLEQAYAGAACVVPNSVAYPEVHAGTLVVEPSRVAEGISSLLQDAAQWTQVAASSRANAAKYTVEQTVKTLLTFVMQVEKAN